MRKCVIHLNDCFSLVLIVGMAAILMLGLACCNQEQQKAKAEEAKELLEIKTKIKELVVKWDAIANWERKIYKDWEFDLILTAEWQELLDQYVKQPIVALVRLKDVTRQGNNGYIGYFVMTSIMDKPIIEFRVPIDKEQYKAITSYGHLEWKGYSSERYALFIKVNEVAYSSELFINNFGTDPKDQNENLIDFQLVPLATGDCLGLVFVGDYTNQELAF